MTGSDLLALGVALSELAPSAMAESDSVYDVLRFARTDPQTTRMVVARRGIELVGLGRLIDLGKDGTRRVFELGGMWVDPTLRRCGLAGAIIDSMLPWLPAETELWCTPFAQLMPLYAAHGFEAIDPAAAPAPLLDRLSLCTSAQEQAVLVTRWNQSAPR